MRVKFILDLTCFTFILTLWLNIQRVCHFIHTYLPVIQFQMTCPFAHL